MVGGYVPNAHPLPPKPKPFDLSDLFQERGVWCFWLAADEAVLQYVQNLSCILSIASNSPFLRRPQGRVYYTINPRYDAQEVWVWLRDLLEGETQQIELSEAWEEAITVACGQDDSDD